MPFKPRIGLTAPHSLSIKCQHFQINYVTTLLVRLFVNCAQKQHRGHTPVIGDNLVAAGQNRRIV
ncbi:MAG: hypothetical protein CMP10_10470 [Zetaproteobacteria bacterium]|nr:hypothetical protein [Pseudobdellovibrionaceae bacterium]